MKVTKWNKAVWHRYEGRETGGTAGTLVMESGDLDDAGQFIPNGGIMTLGVRDKRVNRFTKNENHEVGYKLYQDR
jgi:hypothetical protein